MHNLNAICTEINWLKRGSLVQYSFATEEKSFRGESGTEASRGNRQRNSIRATEDGRQTESDHNMKDRKTDGGAGAARNS